MNKKINWHSIVFYFYIFMIVVVAGHSTNYYKQKTEKISDAVFIGLWTGIAWPAYISYRIFGEKE